MKNTNTSVHCPETGSDMKIYKLEWLEDLGDYNGSKWKIYGYYKSVTKAIMEGRNLKEKRKGCIDTSINEVTVNE